MKILAYDDNPDFGGHQAMASHGLEALAAEPSIDLVCMVNPANRRLAGRLAQTGIAPLLETPCTTRKLQGLRNRLSQGGIRDLAARFAALKPDLVLCIQGDIEQSSQAILAANRAGIPCASYLALPHRLADMGATLGALRDRTNRSLFQKPDRFIAISERMRQLLVERGCTKPVAIVPNGIPLPQAPRARSGEPRAVLGMLGRVEFKQKRQDFMVDCFCRFPKHFADCRLLIAGDGPDAKRLERLIAACPRRNDIEFMPWQADPEAFYGRIDLLLLPSRYEGVPLVMLEALARGIPVVGSDRDGMAELLPRAWTFAAGDGPALAETFARIRNCGQKETGPLQQQVAARYSLDAFRLNFVGAVAG